MDKQEFLKQMVAYGQKLLEEENKPKINKEAKEKLQSLYNNLALAINDAIDLKLIFDCDDKKDKKNKRALAAHKATLLIMKAQELMNPIAEDDDIRIV